MKAANEILDIVEKLKDADKIESDMIDLLVTTRSTDKKIINVMKNKYPDSSEEELMSMISTIKKRFFKDVIKSMNR